MRQFALCLIVATAASGCVHSYNAADYGSVDYVRAADDDGLSFSYLYDAQPGYYGRKAAARGFSVVAVRVTNGSDATATLDRNTLQVVYDQNPVITVRGERVADAVRQPIWNKLLWAFLNFDVGSGNDAEFVPTGPVIAGATIFASTSNNREARRAFTEEDLFGTTVAPGETVERLIFLQGTGRAPLAFDYTPGT